MATPDAALDHYADRKQLAVTAAGFALAQWDKVDRGNIAKSWLRLLPGVAAILSAAQLAAADQAGPYLNEVAPASTVEALVSAAAFAGAAADGRSLVGLLFQPVILALRAIGGGSDVERAMAGGAANLDMIVRTEVADAGRVADQVGMTARPEIDGYIRVVVGDTCNKCIILAGRWYPVSEGFERHPRCDCAMLPASQAEAAGLVQDPMAIYESMTEKERTQAGWSEGEQRAIDAGADINQVTNATSRASRKKAVYTAGGREFTRESTTKRGVTRGKVKHRMTPDQIFIEASDDRDKAIELLRKHGYLIGGADRTAEDLQQQAVDRQAAIDKLRGQAEMLAELEEAAVINETGGEALGRIARRAADRFGVADDPVFEGILRHADAGNAALVEASIETVADRLGLTRIGGELESLQVITFDRARHRVEGSERPGTHVEVIRPGYEAVVDGERLTIIRASVIPTERQLIQAAARRKPVTGAKALAAVPKSMADADLDSGVRDTFSFYKATGYVNLNQVLRVQQGEPMPKSWSWMAYPGWVRDIDGVMARSELAEDVDVAFGVADGKQVFGDAWDRSLAGAEYVEHGYRSTSASRAVAKKFVEPEGALITLRVPRGVQAVQLSGREYESEILLQRGLTIRVVKDSGPGPNRVIDAEVVPAGPAPLDTLTVAQLRALAKANGVKVPSGARKADIVTLLQSPPTDTPADLSNLTVAALRQLAKDRGVKVTSKDRKPDLIAKLSSPPEGKPTAEGREVANAVAHAQALTKDLPDQIRPVVGAALEGQAGVVPGSMMLLREVAIPPVGHPDHVPDGEFANYGIVPRQIALSHLWAAKGDPHYGDLGGQALEYEVAHCRRTGWMSHGTGPGLGQVCAHEFGHHVAAMFARADLSILEIVYDKTAVLQLITAMEKAFGTVGRRHVLQLPQDGYTQGDLKFWMSRNQELLEREVSTYGASKFGELLAEIWQEYSTLGADARPGIRAVGEVMRELAEEGAKVRQ